MECILEWSTVHGIDPNNKSITQYRKAYNEMIAKGVSFPTQKVYFKDPNAQNQKQSTNNSQTNLNKPSQSIQLAQNPAIQKPNISNIDTKKNQSIDIVLFAIVHCTAATVLYYCKGAVVHYTGTVVQCTVTLWLYQSTLYTTTFF